MRRGCAGRVDHEVVGRSDHEVEHLDAPGDRRGAAQADGGVLRQRLAVLRPDHTTIPATGEEKERKRRCPV